MQIGRLPDGDSLQVKSVVVPQKPNLGREDAKGVAEKVVEEVRSR